jgi:hypothetical protein
MKLNYFFVRDKLLQENNSKLDLASQETIPSALRFAENLPKPNGLTNKLTRGAGGPTLRGTSSRYSVKLHTLPLGGSLNQAIILFQDFPIKTTPH